MKKITFFDTEVDPKSKTILDIGGIKEDESIYHASNLHGFTQFMQGTQYVCGHNIVAHDLKYLQEALTYSGLEDLDIIDTLLLAPLLYPTRPYHKLLKDDKLQNDDLNNPLSDSKKARDLFYDEVVAFQKLDYDMKSIFYSLLRRFKGYRAFFQYLDFEAQTIGLENTIRRYFHGQICERVKLSSIIDEHPIELAYALALINTNSRYSITPPWVLKSFPATERVMFLLRNNPCPMGCAYCNEVLDIHKALKHFFGFDGFRTYGGEPLQEKAVRAAVNSQSLLAVFPTGGGKSITFQLPALMSGVNEKGLTVVISPLQSLMKDQVDNLEKYGITDAVTINGLLDPIERSKSIERVEDGSASILYISPESLRSKTIERLLLGRNVVRFVIDEAHCFSSWGQDFRVDYLYIGDFIKSLQKKKNRDTGIPVSCFTATAKPKVIEDILDYFKTTLSLDLTVFSTGVSRSNLHYKVLHKNDEEEKYNTIRNLLDEKKCPTIIYVSRTGRAAKLAARLTEDGYPAKPYHGKMEKDEKKANQDAFMTDEIQIIVATSAFGMGVDKKDVGMVIHYDISDSLENYVQEAGRAGRDESISADCFVLFNDEDLCKHFILLNQTKLSIQEIQQVWKAIKDMTRVRAKVSQSALEIARKAGWEDSILDLETRVRTAIAALENAGYLRRGQNMPRVYADSIQARTTAEAVDRINRSSRFDEKQKQQAIRIIKSLISSRSRSRGSGDEAEARVDYISDHLGIEKEEVIGIINLLREERILADAKDLMAFIKNKSRSTGILKSYYKLERFLLSFLEDTEVTLNIKELNEQAEQFGCKDVTPNKIKVLLNFWAIKGWIKKQIADYSKNHIVVLGLFKKELLEEKLSTRFEVAQFILEYLNEAAQKAATAEDHEKEELPVDFSILELKEAFEERLTLMQIKIMSKDVEDALFYLSRIEAIKLEGGFLVVYNGLSIERLEQDNKRRYKVEDYQKLDRYYESKVQQIHIVGEYARLMIDNYNAALQFVDDYFRLNYNMFLNKYFPGVRQSEIKKNITPAKFQQLFGDLSTTQLQIINDSRSKCIVVAAGPGSGKTRILVHKLAALVLMEDVKFEQLLMLTFSRAAATEFKKRLLHLIGNAANFIEIKTFHSYCFDLLGRVGTLEKSDLIIKEAIRLMTSGEVEQSKISKTVLVIDEAQDMDANEYELVRALMAQNPDMRVIAVGDDDQNIYEFRGSSSQYLERLREEDQAKLYELIENYRSKQNLVAFTNQFVLRIGHRLKKTPITAIQKDNGKIRMVRHYGKQLMLPLVEGILSDMPSGSTCVLTRTNEEALRLAYLISKRGLPARLIQSNDHFNLINLLEVRFFLDTINAEDTVALYDEEVWEKAKRDLAARFRMSTNLEICSRLIQEFEIINPKRKFKSDLMAYIMESKLEDFIFGSMETIYVSTMHKAKGREFDNVYLMLNGFNPGSDEAKRLLYVAMTRAKRNLVIHSNGGYLEDIAAEGIEHITDNTLYNEPKELAIQLTHRDVHLSAFTSFQSAIDSLTSGTELFIDRDCCRNAKGQKVLRFSQSMMAQFEDLRQKRYDPKKAYARFIVYWQGEGMEREIKIVLPEVCFEKDAPG